MTEVIEIDGSQGEGGGQMLRTSLALSLVTGRPFRIAAIRARRSKPGLLRQHLTAVQAAAAVGAARVQGAALGSTELLFAPGRIRGGVHQFAVGTAGSATLVAQTVLPALSRAAEPSTLTLEGGTHNPWAPPFDFLTKTLLPLLRRMGMDVEARLDAYGFYPAGGGRMTFRVTPHGALSPLALERRGDTTVSARALVSAIPDTIADREINVVRRRLGVARERTRSESTTNSVGPGNVVMIAAASAEVTELFTGFGEKGVSAEAVAAAACDEAEAYLATDAPVGTHLADQLLLPMALAGGGSFRTLTPTAHTTTNVEVIRRFLDVEMAICPESATVSRIVVGKGSAT